MNVGQHFETGSQTANGGRQVAGEFIFRAIGSWIDVGGNYFGSILAGAAFRFFRLR